MKSFKIGENSYILKVANYVSNGSLYLGLDIIYDQDLYESYSDISINLDIVTKNNYIFLTNDLSIEMKKELEKINLIKILDRKMPYNMGLYDIAEVNMEKVKELNKEGYEKYINYKDISQSNSLEDYKNSPFNPNEIDVYIEL